MKSAILVAATLGMLTSASTFAQSAPNDKWCRDQGLSRGSIMICSAYTYEQCMSSRTSHIESCFLNPKYDPRFAEWRKRNPNY